VAVPSEITLINQPDWSGTDVPLVAEFDLKMPGWAATAGHHVLIPVGLFGAQEKHLFDAAERVHAIYIPYPYTESDDIEISLPPNWKISSLPAGWTDAGKVVGYGFAAKNDNGRLHLSRSLTWNFILLDSKYYPALRRYIQRIKTTDDEQVLLETPGRSTTATQVVGTPN
jgi:hypothetical protein